MMLAAESQTDGRSARSRKGMDCKTKKQPNMKLVQARLPFKRLNPEPKDSQEPKRSRAPLCLKLAASDGENEAESSPVLARKGPALVKGCGPLDGFFSRGSVSTENMCIDLTGADSPVKCPSKPAAPALSPEDKLPITNKQVSTGDSNNGSSSTSLPSKAGTSDCKVVSEAESESESDLEESVIRLDTTQDSESEGEEQDKSMKANESVMSPSSVSSMSAAESSPEQAKKNESPTSTDPNTTPKVPADEMKGKRRSLKSLQEQDEMLQMRQEKERQKEDAKSAKEQKKEEARRLKEEREKERKEKREKEERDKREKKEKEEKEKADRLKAKEEQRKSKQEAKLEEKRKKDEDKRLKEEEKRMKEEKDRLKATKAEITRFLQKPKTQLAPKTLSAACGKFAPFEIKDHMCLAPLCRVECGDAVLEELDRCLEQPSSNTNALNDWIKKPRRSGRTKPRGGNPLSESIIVEEEPKPEGAPDRKRYGAMKLLQFHVNHRPAYWGTWSKKSTHISPRCPLKQDKDLLDYEVDSDDEWEEEEPGESLSHSEGEDEEEGGEEAGDNDDNEDEDDGFFVPHGYLSNDEGALEEEEGGDLEKKKVRQKLKAREWDELMSSKKVKVLQAVVRGCVWVGEKDCRALDLLQPYAVCLIEPLPKADTSPSPEDLTRKSQRLEQLLEQLLPLLHGNANSSKVIITEFQEFCRQQTFASSPQSALTSPSNAADNIPTRISLKRIIKSNAMYEKRSTHRCCWYVHGDVLTRLGQEALPVPCKWSYLTAGAREEEPPAATGSQGNSPGTPQPSSTSATTSANKRKSAGSMSITKFMKKCADRGRTEPMETDGFQADTEEDADDDCVIISKSDSSKETTSGTNAETGGSDQMIVSPSDTPAATALSSPAPTVATA